VSWMIAEGGRALAIGLTVAATAAVGIHFALPAGLGVSKLAVSEYKGVAYARKLPDSRRVLHQLSPFGDLQVYASSYLHFAPGLSDNAAFTLPELPRNAYLGLYLDGDGPVGVIRDLPVADTAYFTYLPIVYPYLLHAAPDVFVAQFGGGISTALALREGAASVTIAEPNPTILQAFVGNAELGAFTGHLLQNERVRVIGNEGRLFLRASGARYDIVDLSLANSAGLSSPGGFPIVERYGYTREAMLTYMRALKPGGVLAVTLWNKEEPPKSVLRLYATMVDAARDFDPAHVADRFFAVASYLSTTTVLYKNGAFTPGEIAKLRAHSEAMSFDDLYYPGSESNLALLPGLLDAYRDQVLGEGTSPESPPDTAVEDAATTMPMTLLGRRAWAHLVRGDWADIAGGYVFDVGPLTDNRPYFAGYIMPRELPELLDRLEIVQDEWGYLLLWVTLGIAALGAALLLGLPFCFGWRLMFHHFPGKAGSILYFACLGLGYISVELGLISKFVLAFSNYMLSAEVVIPAMLVSSGIGSLMSRRLLGWSRAALPVVLGAIGILLLAGALWLDPVLGWVGGLPPAWRPVGCCALILPPALLMGIPMPLAMTTLVRLGKDRMFVWAWGLNGCFSVIGAALVPIVATSLGLNAVLAIAGGSYLIPIPALGALFRPGRSDPAVG
jgi:hypothetical protein